MDGEERRRGGGATTTGGAGGEAPPRALQGGRGAGLGVERVEGSEEMLHPRGIEPRLTVGGESGRRRELGGGTNGGGGLGFEGERGRGSTRIRRRVREERRGGTGCEDCQHVARLTRMAGGGATRARGAERNRGEGEGEADVWARLGIFFFFSFFFFLGSDNLPPLRKSRPEILVDERGRIKLGLG